MTMAERKELVSSLVARYKKDEASYKASTFNEASTRGLFLNGLLKALGWDVNNAAGMKAVLGAKPPSFAKEEQKIAQNVLQATSSSSISGQRMAAKTACGDTADKHGTKPVDDVFLEVIERWRETLAMDKGAAQ